MVEAINRGRLAEPPVFVVGVGVLFVALNNSGVSGSKDAAAARNAWLKDVLAEHARLPRV